MCECLCPERTHSYFLQEFSQDVEAHAPALDGVTGAELTLFASDLWTVQVCEEHLSAASPPARPSSDVHPSPPHDTGYLESSVDPEMESSVDKLVLPEWLERPGAPEAVVIGQDLRARYGKLGVHVRERTDEVRLNELSTTGPEYVVCMHVHVPYSTYYTPMGDALYSVTEEGGGRTIRSFMRSNVV